MKNLLISLLFLLAIPTSLQASKDYSKTIFNKQIGNKSWNNIKVIKSYDSFYEKTNCSFNLKATRLNIRIMVLDSYNYELELSGNNYTSHDVYRDKRYAFKFDNNPIETITSSYSYPLNTKLIPFSEWSKYKYLTIKNGNEVDKVKLKDLVKAIDKYKECKRSLNW